MLTPHTHRHTHTRKHTDTKTQFIQYSFWKKVQYEKEKIHAKHIELSLKTNILRIIVTYINNENYL